MLNSRGSKYSRLHKTLDPDRDEKYWDFTWHDMGIYDTKACIKYIKSETNNEKIAYMGFSQGAKLMFYSLAKNSDWYKDHLSIFVAVTPVLKNGWGPIADNAKNGLDNPPSN